MRKTLMQVWGDDFENSRVLATFATDAPPVWFHAETQERLESMGLPGSWLKPTDAGFFNALDEAYKFSTTLRIVNEEPSQRLLGLRGLAQKGVL